MFIIGQVVGYSTAWSMTDSNGGSIETVDGNRRTEYYRYAQWHDARIYAYGENAEDGSRGKLIWTGSCVYDGDTAVVGNLADGESYGVEIDGKQYEAHIAYSYDGMTVLWVDMSDVVERRLM